MKRNKLLILILMLVMVFSFSSCKKEETKTNNIDYSKIENWFKCDYTGDKEVDTIYIYPTVIISNEGETTIDQNREAIKKMGVYNAQASVYESNTNLYVPLYRQISLNNAVGLDNKGYVETIVNTIGYQDVSNALDYYFEHFNNNKPFILAGHSQGSATICGLLINYFQEHQEYLKQMVACYAIGYGISKSMIAKYPNLKFAQGELDTGCIISYNTYGPNHTGNSILLNDDCYCINPLNWKTDSTYASIEENKGSYVNCNKTAGLSDAQVDTAHGYLVSTADLSYGSVLAAAEALFGTQSFHMNDYGFFYENLKDNISKRISIYLANEQLKVR